MTPAREGSGLVDRVQGRATCPKNSQAKCVRLLFEDLRGARVNRLVISLSKQRRFRDLNWSERRPPLWSCQWWTGSLLPAAHQCLVGEVFNHSYFHALHHSYLCAPAHNTDLYIQCLPVFRTTMPTDPMSQRTMPSVKDVPVGTCPFQPPDSQLLRCSHTHLTA
jgi:hypothetical protein